MPPSRRNTIAASAGSSPPSPGFVASAVGVSPLVSTAGSGILVTVSNGVVVPAPSAAVVGVSPVSCPVPGVQAASKTNKIIKLNIFFIIFSPARDKGHTHVTQYKRFHTTKTSLLAKRSPIL